MPSCPQEACRRGIEDVLAHWNPGYVPAYGIPFHLILGLLEGLVRERDDEARGLPHEPAPQPIARRLRALFRRGGREARRVKEASHELAAPEDTPAGWRRANQGHGGPQGPQGTSRPGSPAASSGATTAAGAAGGTVATSQEIPRRHASYLLRGRTEGP
jgi:hypothetical protein